MEIFIVNMDNSLELIAKERTERLRLVFDTIERDFPGIRFKKGIAYELGYRANTLSEYLNWNYYKEDKFESFLTHLQRIFHVNPDFVKHGTLPMFKVDRTAIETTIRNSLAILEQDRKQLIADHEAEISEKDKIIADLKKQLSSKDLKVAPMKAYGEQADVVRLVAEKEGTYGTKKPASSQEEQPDNSTPKETKPKKKK